MHKYYNMISFSVYNEYILNDKYIFNKLNIIKFKIYEGN